MLVGLFATLYFDIYIGSVLSYERSVYLTPTCISTIRPRLRHCGYMGIKLRWQADASDRMIIPLPGGAMGRFRSHSGRPVVPNIERGRFKEQVTTAIVDLLNRQPRHLI